MRRVLGGDAGRLEVADGRLLYYQGARRVADVALDDIDTATAEEGKEFRHPRLGLAFGLLLLLSSAAVLAVVLAQGNLAALVPVRLGSTVALGLVLGSWVLYGVLSSPCVCWLRLRLRRGRGHRLSLPGVGRDELEALAAELTASRPG